VNLTVKSNFAANFLTLLNIMENVLARAVEVLQP